jgi:hypothetical protein
MSQLNPILGEINQFVLGNVSESRKMPWFVAGSKYSIEGM